MAKQRSTRSRGAGKSGAETTIGPGLEPLLEPLLLALDERALNAIAASSEALGRILCSGSIAAEHVDVLSEAEDRLDRIVRALESVSEAVTEGVAPE